jgi:uncharacterized membrane protein YqiK
MKIDKLHLWISGILLAIILGLVIFFTIKLNIMQSENA